MKIDLRKVIGTSPFALGKLRDLIAAEKYFSARGITIQEIADHLRSIDGLRKPPEPVSKRCDCGGRLVLMPISGDESHWACRKCRKSIYDGRPIKTIIEGIEK